MKNNICYSLIVCFLSVLASTTSAEANPRVSIETNYGNIVIELYPGKSPQTVSNFLAYVEDGHYTDTVFHRVIKGFMIQGGGYDQDYKLKPTKPPIKNEADNGLSNLRGTIAMARTNVPDSATSQFFINTVDNSRLDFKYAAGSGWGYCVFGKVVSGMNVVNEIASVPTGPAGPFPQNAPQGQVIIEKVTLLDTQPTHRKEIEK